MLNRTIARCAGACSILFGPMLLLGFLLHPDLLSFAVADTPEALLRNFHHQWGFHAGHALVFASVPLIVCAVTYPMSLEVTDGRALIVGGGAMAVIGAVILAGDKGALCMVLSAFDTLSELELQQITPALRSIVERRGLLAIFYLLPLLTIGAALQLWGLVRARILRKASGVAGIGGLLLLNNPDIEIISSVGAVLMCLAYVPFGVRLWKGAVVTLPSELATQPAHGVAPRHAST